MKRRILSLVLALMMCFTVLSTAVIAEDIELMGSPMGDTIRLYTDRVWDWQEGQFDAMTDEQMAVIEAAYGNFDKEVVKGIAAETAEDVLANNTTFFTNDTMADLYKWKTMRDLMEGRLDATSDDADYQAWLAEFTAYEEANDEAISASKPGLALNGLGDYSADLTVFFGELATLYHVNGLRLEGDDAEKVHAYIEAYDYEHATDDMTNVMNYLKADVIELIAEGSANGFELVIMVACGEKVRGDAIFDEIPDRDMKAAFLLFGEDFVRYLMDEVPSLREDLVGMEKKDLLEKLAGVGGAAINVINGCNETSYDAMYEVANEVSAYIEGQAFLAEVTEKLTNDFGIDVSYTRKKVLEGTKSAMATLDASHGVELVHFNAYVGRTVLQPEMDSVIEVNAGEETVIELSYDHPRYKFIGETLATLPPLTQFDIAVEGEGITATLGEGIGEIIVDATADGIKDGDEITLYLYRGYDDDINADEKDAYRYVTTYTVKAVGSTAPEVETIELDDIADFKLSENENAEVIVKGTTTLDHVVVSITLGENEVYTVTHTKAEFEAGITVKIDGAAVGNVYTVAVGQDGTEAEDTFEILAEDVVKDTIKLDDIANFKLSENENAEVIVKGTTTLDYVVVSITLEGDEVYTVTHTKAEFEAGITVKLNNAVAGNVYTVAVGQTGTEAKDTFEILAEDAVKDTIKLDDIADFRLSENENAEVIVKGTTTLDYVVVSITLEGDEVYTVTHTKAEFEAGITVKLNNAVAGNVYTVAVGQDGTEAEDTFKILPEIVVTPFINLDDIADFKLSENENAEVIVKGTTTLDHVVVSIVLDGAEVYTVTHTKAEFEAGITVKLNNAVAGNVYTVAVGQTGLEAEDTFEILSEVDPPADPVLKLAGDADGDGIAKRTVKKGKEITVSTTIQNIPADATKVEVRWTITNGEGVVEEVKVTGDYNNNITVRGITVGEGVVITGTLYVDGVATTETVTVNVTVTRSGGGGGGGGGVTPTEPSSEEPTVDGGDTKPHSCQWPDIAATTTKSAHWAHLTIDQMTINGYIAGYPDGTFKPDQNITRAEFAAIVYRILGLQEAEDGVLYEDTVGHWAEDIIATMSLPEGYGMLRGYGDDTFGPNDNITREQAVAIIARAKSAVWVAAEDGARKVFTDADDISWWFNGEMDAAVTNGLITGYEDGSYKPLNYTTRAEACTLLARAWPEVLD